MPTIANHLQMMKASSTKVCETCPAVPDFHETHWGSSLTKLYPRCLTFTNNHTWLSSSEKPANLANNAMRTVHRSLRKHGTNDHPLAILPKPGDRATGNEGMSTRTANQHPYGGCSCQDGGFSLSTLRGPLRRYLFSTEDLPRVVGLHYTCST